MKSDSHSSRKSETEELFKEGLLPDSIIKKKKEVRKRRSSALSVRRILSMFRKERGSPQNAYSMRSLNHLHIILTFLGRSAL